MQQLSGARRPEPLRTPLVARISVVAGGALAATAVLLGSTVAVADSGSGGNSSGSSGGNSGVSAASIMLNPSQANPGASVTMVVDCSGYQSPNPTTVSSRAFSAAIPLHAIPGELGRYSAAATVNPSISTGSYSVTGSCKADGDSTAGFSTMLTVGPRTQPTKRPHHDNGNQQITGPVRTGLGGASHPGSPAQIVIGGTLMAAAVGTVLWRRRAASSGGGGAGD